LKLAVYDPALSFSDALNHNVARLQDVDADSVSSLGLGFKQWKFFGSITAYDYDFSITTIPAQNMSCDLSTGDEGICFATFYLRFPSFLRTNIVQQRSLAWTVSKIARHEILTIIVLT